MSERNDQVLKMAAVMESKCKSQCVCVVCVCVCAVTSV